MCRQPGAGAPGAVVTSGAAEFQDTAAQRDQPSAVMETQAQPGRASLPLSATATVPASELCALPASGAGAAAEQPSHVGRHPSDSSGSHQHEANSGGSGSRQHEASSSSSIAEVEAEGKQELLDELLAVLIG
jgi:hypothetical protein